MQKYHKDAVSQSQQVIDKITSQQNVKYGTKKKVEMRCCQWHFHLKTAENEQVPDYHLYPAFMSYLPPTGTQQNQASSENILQVHPVEQIRVLPVPSTVQVHKR